MFYSLGNVGVDAFGKRLLHVIDISSEFALSIPRSRSRSSYSQFSFNNVQIVDSNIFRL